MKITLENCNLEPMSSYMKALGLFRLLAEQKCVDIKAYWESNNFVLDSCINKQEIMDFLLNEYSPSSVISPWNRGNYLYLHKQHPNEKNDIYKTLMAQNAPRFSRIKSDIEKLYGTKAFSYRTEKFSDFYSRFDNTRTTQNSKSFQKFMKLLDKIKTGSKGKFKLLEQYNTDKEIKECIDIYEKAVMITADVISEARATLSDNFVEWLDTCLVLDSSLNKITAPLLGTGGNEGNLEYSTEFMKYIILMLIKKDDATELLESSLFGTPTDKLKKEKIGKFYPGRSGGYNQGNDIENKDFYINPWDFILLIEGLFLWSNSTSRKDTINPRSYIMSPFTVKLFPAGYSSSDIPDKKSSETWAPLWEHPVHLEELKALFSYGRAVYNNSYAKTGLEFLEAVKSLGVDKGITRFVRYVTHQRKGQGNFLAIPVSSISVGYNPKILKLNKVNRMVQTFIHGAPSNNIPESHKQLLRSVNNAVFNFAVDTSTYNAQKLISLLGKMEIYASVRKKQYSTLGYLQEDWIEYANDNSPEFRIALSIASINGHMGSIRKELEPVNQKCTGWIDSTWVNSWIGKDLPNKMTNLVYRRLLKATQQGLNVIPLYSVFGATLEDVSMFIDEQLDEDKIEGLVLGLAMINFESAQRIDKIRRSYEQTIKKQEFPVNIPYVLLKSALTPDLDSGTVIESSIIPLLRTNRIREAVNIAQRRLLVNKNLYSHISVPDSKYGIRLSAALLIPLRKEEDLLGAAFGKKFIEKEVI